MSSADPRIPNEPDGAAPVAPSDPAAASLLDLERRRGRTQRLAALGALVARLAHELGTPLHSIAGHVDLVMRDEGVPPAARARLELVSQEVRRLSRLIRRYLERLRTPLPAPEPQDLHAVVQDVLAMLGPVLAERDIALGIDVDEGVEAPIAFDRDQIEQVVFNLVQNAIDAMPKGGTLTIRLGCSGLGRSLSVCDSGRGVAPDVREHVFEPFFTTKGGGRGSGLGLAICREIARAHGGDVRLDSKPGLGTVVTVTIQPLATTGIRP